MSLEGDIKKDKPQDAAQLGLQRLRPHEALWFDDASIVLATDIHVYRVHKSMLSKYSSVFKDMLEIPFEGVDEDGATGVDRWDGLPLVRMAGDSDENVSHLLMALYDREYVLPIPHYS